MADTATRAHYEAMIAALRKSVGADWQGLDTAVGALIAEEIDVFTNNVNGRLLRLAAELERECTAPPCKHAEGVRLAISYVEQERLVPGEAK